MMKKINSRIPSALLIFAVLLMTSSYPFWVEAASFTVIKDTMSTQAKSTPADHTLTWTPAGHANSANGVVTIAFTSSDLTSSGTWATNDFAYSDNTRASATPVAVGQDASPASCSGHSGSGDYIVNVTTASDIFTITFCGSWSASNTSTARTFVILGATGGAGTLTNASGDVNSSPFTITDSVNDTDVGLGAIVIESNDVVTITATVQAVLTFAVSSNTVALGTLSSSAASSATHTVDVSTNAAGGYAVTYNGPTLTSGLNTIPAYNSSGGTPVVSSAGTAGFGINLRSNATPSVGADASGTGCSAGVASDYSSADHYTCFDVCSV